jgi:hypothetical protein
MTDAEKIAKLESALHRIIEIIDYEEDRYGIDTDKTFVGIAAYSKITSDIFRVANDAVHPQQ